MITTISMQVKPASPAHTIPTRRQSVSRTAALCVATIIGAAVLGAILTAHGLARSATAPVSGSVGGAAAPMVVVSASETSAMRAAVQSLHAFPDPYPASAAVAP